MCLQYKSFENTVRKGEIARNEQFLLFPQCFLSFWRTFFHFLSNLKLSSANSFNLEESKFLSFKKRIKFSDFIPLKNLFTCTCFVKNDINLHKMTLFYNYRRRFYQLPLHCVYRTKFLCHVRIK